MAACILAVDDDPASLDILQARLAANGYEVLTASDGAQALAVVHRCQPDLVVLDVMMPGLDGVEVCRRLRADAAIPFVPIILLTARADSTDVIAGLDAGADEYLTKPVDHNALIARVRSMLRIKQLHDTTRQQALQLADWNKTLEARVAQQVDELQRLSHLRRFLAPQLADLIVAGHEDSLLETHRREIVVVFCQLAGFTAFAEAAEPEEVLAVLREYHAAVDDLIVEFRGTVDRFAGHVLMVFFNDPIPLPDPAVRAIRMAVAMRDRVAGLRTRWVSRGHDVAFVAGIAMGYATLGTIGSESQLEYAAVGAVTDLAARLCDEAPPGQILASQRVCGAAQDVVEATATGPLALRGFIRSVSALRILGLAPATPKPPDASPLSPREEEVAALVAGGATNREIGESLSIAERTVAAHIEHILDKLGFTSRTQIGVWAAARQRTA